MYTLGSILKAYKQNDIHLSVAVDVRKAGEGQLEIMVNSGNIPNTVESDTTGVYRMSFIPEEPGLQKVEIIFNKESHPGI